MTTIRTIIALISVLGVLNVSGLEAQRRTSPLASSDVLVNVTTDVKAVFTFDRSTVSNVSPGRGTTVRVAPGRYRFRAATEDGKTYWEQLVVVRSPGPMTVTVALAEAAKRRLAEDEVLELLQAQRVVDVRAIRAVRGEVEASRSRASNARSASTGQAAVALQRVEATIKAIKDLDRLADSYTRAAGKLTTDAGNISSQANAQNPNTPIGALAGLIGTIGANSLEKDAWRNRMRARGALRRVNRLTGGLSEASDKGFNYLPDPAQMSAVFSTARKGTPGQLKITDGRLEYSENQKAGAGGTPAGTGFSAACSEVRSVRTRGADINIRIEGQEVTVSPIGITSEDALAEIFIACPTRNF